jgi:hypothetical protein
MRRLGTVCLSLVAGCCLAIPALADAPEDSIFNELRAKYSDKKLAAELGDRVLAAARPKSSKDSKVLDYKFTESLKENTATYWVSMEYQGADTGKTYVADITVECDTKNKKAWEVTAIHYKDPDNPKKPFASDIKELVKKLNNIK